MLLTLLTAGVLAVLAAVALVASTQYKSRTREKSAAATGVHAAATRSFRGGGGGGRLTAEEKRAGLERMNELRRQLVSLPPSDALPAAKQVVPPLVWDERLEAAAQEWADGCPTGHRPRNPYGENMAWATSNDLVASANLWDAERANIDKAAVRRQGAGAFTFSTLQQDWCRGGWGACGHATQQLWAETRRVGCARASTPCTVQGRQMSLVVCNYDPPGNYENRQVYRAA